MLEKKNSKKMEMKDKELEFRKLELEFQKQKYEDEKMRFQIEIEERRTMLELLKEGMKR